MDLTVLHLAVPSLSADLMPSSSQLLWIVDIYGFMIAGFLITMGTLGDRVGRRRLLLVGAAAFGFITAAAERFDWPPVDIEVIRVRASPATLRQRLRKRGLERDRKKLAHWDEYWATHGGRPCAWTGVRLSEFLNDANEAGSSLDKRSNQTRPGKHRTQSQPANPWNPSSLNLS
jgi:hypothetical protein